MSKQTAFGIFHDLKEIVRVEVFADHAHRQAADEFRLESVLYKILRRDVLKQLVVHHLNRRGAKPDLALSDTAGDLLFQLPKPAAHLKKNMTRIDGFAFGLATSLKFECGLQLRLKIVHASHRHFRFFH